LRLGTHICSYIHLQQRSTLRLIMVLWNPFEPCWRGMFSQISEGLQNAQGKQG
jgi:hypothetical protein